LSDDPRTGARTRARLGGQSRAEGSLERGLAERRLLAPAQVGKRTFVEPVERGVAGLGSDELGYVGVGVLGPRKAASKLTGQPALLR
jgi:hypothetical protein